MSAVGNKRSFSDLGGRKTLKAKPVQVVSFTRRTDGPANSEMLKTFLEGLKKGSVVYAHPKFATNPGNKRYVTYKVFDGAIISWWSKDFSLLIGCWKEHEQVLCKYHHHFSFTINGPERSLLEPGLESTLSDRIDRQLPWIVDKCKELGQDPDWSIMVHVDPIASIAHTAHIPELTIKMASLGLSRVHISFVQFGWPSVGKRLAPTGTKELTLAERQQILTEKVLPYTSATAIRVQTCTAFGLEDLGVLQGACVGFDDICHITDGRAPEVEPESPEKRPKCKEHCTCYPHRDVGDKTEKCKHGCRYCFSNPKIYDF